MKAALRRRIVAAMPDILDIISNDWRINQRGPTIGDHDDFRQLIVAGIWRIAALEKVPPHIARRRIERAVSHLRRAQQVLEGLGADLIVDDLEVTHKQLEAFTPPPKLSTKQLATRLAHDLLVDWAPWAPSLADEGAYVRLTALLHHTATGKRGGDFKRTCMAHVKAIADTDCRLDTGRRSGHPAPEAKRMLWTEVEELHEGAKIRIAKWPPLLQVIDRVVRNPRFFLRAELPKK